MSSGLLLCLLYISLTQWLLLSNYTLALIMTNKNKQKKRVDFLQSGSRVLCLKENFILLQILTKKKGRGRSIS